MSDVRDVLERTTRSVEREPSDETVEADLRRGRTALVRLRRGRRIRWGVVGVAAVVVVAGTVVVAGNSGRSSDANRPTARSGNGRHATAPANVGPVRLVAYTGDQLEGFVVDQVPAGWFLQGSNQFRLTIAPQGDATSPDDFVGKLVVMLLSSSAAQKLPPGNPVDVGGHDGVVTQDDENHLLTYEDGAGHIVQIQALRTQLGWSDEQLVSFAEGVQVTSDAEAGVG